MKRHFPRQKSPLFSALFLFSCLASLFLSACGGSSNGNTAPPSQAPAAYCSTITSYSNAVSITGSAGYQYRADGNGAVTGPNPIRYAEIIVQDSSGQIIQCGETNSLGQFTLNVPQGEASLQISVRSRANNSFLKAYVMGNTQSNQAHQITGSFVPDQTKSIGSLIAPATGALQGGAFNILDKILDTNDFLRTQTSNCNTFHSSCSPFTVAPLAYIYWTAGEDIGNLTFGNSIVGASFYIRDSNQIYLLGGSNGDINNSDTDHFDNTIIIHEYGHFLENFYSFSDSPGGPHSGNTIIDPRLAWSEAFANYLQAVVTGDFVYRDTSGTIEGSASVFFNEDLENGSNDNTNTLGEANFREFSITRALVDIIDSNNECFDGINNPAPGGCPGSNIIDDITAPFDEFWTVFTSSVVGFRASNVFFRDIGLFYSLQNVLTGKTDWSNIQDAESQLASRDDYSNTLTLGGAACPISIQAANIPGVPPQFQEDGSAQNSNQFASNDFYQYTHGGGNLTISLSYTTNPVTPADLNLYLYNSDYTFGSLADVVAFSENTISGGSGSESISLTNLAAGTYMININVYTGDGLGSLANYNLLINGQNACPN